MFRMILFAYLDPGSGSYLIQFVIAGLFGLAFAMKSFWRKIAGFFANIPSGKKNDGDDS